jgi:hypothetical protein
LVCDANGVPIPLSNDKSPPSYFYYLSPLASDDIFTMAGAALGAQVKARFVDAGTRITAIANQREYGIGLAGWHGAKYNEDPRWIAARNGESTARLLSRHTARQEELIQRAFYQASTIPTSVPYYSYTQGYGNDRGRWSGWANWTNFYEDFVRFNDYPGPEFYMNSDLAFTESVAGKTINEMDRALCAVGGQIRLGRPLMVPWCSPGGWKPAFLEGVSRDRYTGFLKSFSPWAASAHCKTAMPKTTASKTAKRSATSRRRGSGGWPIWRTFTRSSATWMNTSTMAICFPDQPCIHIR